MANAYVTIRVGEIKPLAQASWAGETMLITINPEVVKDVKLLDRVISHELSHAIADLVVRVRKEGV